MDVSGLRAFPALPVGCSRASLRCGPFGTAFGPLPPPNAKKDSAPARQKGAAPPTSAIASPPTSYEGRCDGEGGRGKGGLFRYPQIAPLPYSAPALAVRVLATIPSTKAQADADAMSRTFRAAGHRVRERGKGHDDHSAFHQSPSREEESRPDFPISKTARA